ncbi:MAG: CARDB domain-containing protein [Armatimonadota bacterium]
MALLAIGTVPARFATAEEPSDVRYTVRDLGTLGGPEAVPLDLSDNGIVGGFAEAPAPNGAFYSPPVVWKDGQALDLNIPLPRSGETQAVNKNGQAAGYYHTGKQDRQGMAIRTAFFWNGTTRVDLPGLGGSLVSIKDMNDQGQVVGWATLPQKRGRPGRLHAALWQDGLVRDLGDLGGTYSEAVDINNHGQVVGSASTGETDPAGHPVFRAFIWADGRLQMLGEFGVSSSATAINDRGQVVGYYSTGEYTSFGAPIRHAFLWEEGEMTDLGTLGGSSYASFINERGQIAGYSEPDGERQSVTRAVLWDNGQLIDLGTLGGDYSRPTGLNDLGQVVGTSEDTVADGYAPGFLWENGQMHRLDQLVAAGANWKLEEPLINNQGQIVVFAIRGYGRRVAMLTPEVPAPADLSIDFSPDRDQVTGPEAITFTATVTNHGPNPALDVDTVVSGRASRFAVVSVASEQGTTVEFLNMSFATGVRKVVRWSIPELEPGASAVLRVTLRPTYTGTEPVEAVVGSGDDYNAANNRVVVPITSELDPRPDLQVAWERVKLTRSGRWRRLSGVVQVGDVGAAAGPSDSRVRLYLSDDATPDDADLLLQEIRVRGLAPGEIRSLKMKARVSKKTRVLGRYLLAVADPGDQVDEQLEDNNVSVLKLD